MPRRSSTLCWRVGSARAVSELRIARCSFFLLLLRTTAQYVSIASYLVAQVDRSRLDPRAQAVVRGMMDFSLMPGRPEAPRSSAAAILGREEAVAVSGAVQSGNGGSGDGTPTTFVAAESAQWRFGLLQQGDLSESQLRQIRVPTLLVASARDRLLPSTEETARLSKLVPDARRVILPDCAHTPMLEQGINIVQVGLLRRINPLARPPLSHPRKASALLQVLVDSGLVEALPSGASVDMTWDASEGVTPLEIDSAELSLASQPLICAMEATDNGAGPAAGEVHVIRLDDTLGTASVVSACDAAPDTLSEVHRWGCRPLLPRRVCVTVPETRRRLLRCTGRGCWRLSWRWLPMCRSRWSAVQAWRAQAPCCAAARADWPPLLVPWPLG